MCEETKYSESNSQFVAVPLGVFATVEMGQSPPSQYVSDDAQEGLPFLQGNAEFGKANPTPLHGCTRPAKVAEAGSILVSVRAPVGAINIAEQRYCIGRGLASVMSSLMPASLLAAIIGHNTHSLRRVAQGTTFEAISKDNLAKLMVSLPPRTELFPIARILDTLDQAIHETEALIEKLKAVKQGLLHDLLTRGIDESGQLRPPRDEAPELYKETGLGWVPREWEVPLLDTVAIRGSGHTPSKSNSSYWNGGIKWVSLADSDKLDDIYIYATDKEISLKGIENSSAVLHPTGTVILSRDAGIGKSSILALDMAVSQHFIAWRCGQFLCNLYLYYWLQSMKPVFEAIAMGSTIKTIGLAYFKKLRLPIPSVREQECIGQILLANENDIKRHATHLLKLKTLKTALMDDLLTGRVRVRGVAGAEA